MPLHFSNATNDVIDTSDPELRKRANDPRYRYDPITKEFVLKTVPVVLDQSGRNKDEGGSGEKLEVTPPPFVDQSDRANTEGTGSTVTTPPVVVDTPHGAPVANKTNGAASKPVVVSDTTVDTVATPDTSDEPIEFDEFGDPIVDPTKGRFAPGEQIESEIDVDTTIDTTPPVTTPPVTTTPRVTTPPVVEEPAVEELSEKDQLVEKIRAANQTGRTPDPADVARLDHLTTVEAINYEVPSWDNGGVTAIGGTINANRTNINWDLPDTAPERTTSVGSDPTRVVYADGRVLVGDMTTFGMWPGSEEPNFGPGRFLTEAEYNKEVADIKAQQQESSQAYNSFQQKIQSAVSAGQLGELPDKSKIEASQLLNPEQKAELLAMYPPEAEPEVDAGTQAYNSFQTVITSAIAAGQPEGLPSKDEIRASRFLSGEQKTALLNMYPKPPVVETPAVSTQPDAGQTDRVVDTTVDTTVDTAQDGMSEEEFNALPEEDQLVERIRRANKAGLTPKQEWLDRLDEITQSQEKLSLGTAEFQGWNRRASAGDVNIDEIKGLNLTPYQEENLINSYNRGLADRAAANQVAIDQQAEEEQRLSDEAEEARIQQEAVEEQQRKQDEIDEAASEVERKRVEDRHNLVQGFKDKLLVNPDFVVNMDQLRGSDSTAADELQYWMETSSEYAQAVRDAGLSGEGKTEVGGEFDVTEDGEVELDEDGRPPIPTTYDGKPIDIDKLIAEGKVSADKPWVFYSSAEYPMLNIPEPGRWEPNFIMSTGLPPQDKFVLGPDGKPMLDPHGNPIPLRLERADGDASEEPTGYEGYGQDIQQQVATWQGSNPRQPGELDHEYHNRMARDLKSEKIGLRSAPGEAMAQALSITHPWLKSEDRGPLTEFGTEFDETAEETTETFLNRMPAVPTDKDNIDAFNWLADQGVSGEDAQKWFDWAKSSGRTAVAVGTGTEVGTDFDVTTDEDEVPFHVDPEKPVDANLEQYATITPDLDPERIKSLVDAGFDTPSIVRAGELHKSDGIDAFNGYLEAAQAGTSAEWETNYADLKAAEGEDPSAEDDPEIDSIYVVGSPEYEAAVAAVNIEDLILRIPEPPTDLDAMGKFFWLASQVDDAGNPLLTATEAQAYYEWSKTQQENIDKNTSVDGPGGVGDASDPANLERIQGTIADEIEKVVKDMGFNSDEYKASQTTAIDARYEDARVRLGRQFAIDPGGTKTGRAQRAFETIENQRIQDLATLDTEVQDRLQAARDSTITNLVNAFSSITTGKMAEDQLDEQERQFNTELRESVRQFNNDIAIRLKEFGLSETEVEAAIAKINSDIVNNTRSISATISQAWADVTGDVGVPGGVISLEDLGIPESEWSMFPYLPASDEMKNTIKMSFEAMLGRSITDDEMTNLMSNGRIKVDDNMPTQRAREFAATITQQNMDRISQYDAIAESNGLDRDKFTDAKERADKDWARTNLEVAEEFGLDNNTFRNSMWDLDQRLSKIFFNEDYTEVERDRARRGAINDVSRLYFPDEQGSFLQAKDQYDVLYGDRERAVATAFGMDAQTFARANKQADIQEKRFLDVWESLLSDVAENSFTLDIKASTTRGTDMYMEGYAGFQTDLMQVFSSHSYDPSNEGDSQAMVLDFYQNASDENKDQVRALVETMWPEMSFTEENLKASMEGFFRAAIYQTKDSWDIKFQEEDWFSQLKGDEQSALMSLLGTTNFSAERAAGGTSALASIGRAFGIGAGAIIGGVVGGPAGVAAGAQAGAAATSGLQ